MIRPWKFDLQYFAEDDQDDMLDDFNGDTDDDGTTPGADDKDTQSKEKTFTQKELDQILYKERKRYERRAAQKSEEPKREAGFDEQSEYTKILNEYLDEGYDESFCKRMAKRDVSQKKELYEMKQLLSKNSDSDIKYQYEIDKLINKSPDLFDDLNDEEVRISVINTARAKKISIKAAYVDLYGDEAFTKIETKTAERIKSELKRKQATDYFDTSSAGEPAFKPGPKYTKAEAEMAKALNMDVSAYKALEGKSAFEIDELNTIFKRKK